MPKTIPIRCKAADLVPLSRLKIIQKDLKSLSEQNFGKLASEIEDKGFSFAIHVWDDGKNLCILDGTQRYRVVKMMVEKGAWDCPKLPVAYVEAESFKEAVKKLLGGAGMYGRPEGEGLRELMEIAGLELGDLANIELPYIDMPKFAEEFFTEPLPGEGAEDECPDVPLVSVVRRGDLFNLGHHRLLCGDSTKKDDVERLMNGERAALMVTDPPYGVNYDPDWRTEAARSGGINGGAGPGRGKITNDDKVEWGEIFPLWLPTIVYLWHVGRHAKDTQSMLEAAGYEIVSQIIWAKPSFAISRGDYHWQHEPCWYAVKRGEKHNWQGSRSDSTLWPFKRGENNANNTGHGSEKPVGCMEKPILNNSESGALVSDPFLGSGSTLIACEKTNRRCFGMEIDPHYCDVILDRWEKYTGRSAIREDGVPWSKIKETP